MKTCHTTESNDPRDVVVLAIARGLSVEMYPERAEGIKRLGLSASLERDFGFDSLSRAELLSRIESTFSITFADAVMTDALTPADLLSAVGTDSAFAESKGVSAQVIATAPSVVDRRIALDSQTLVEVLERHAQTKPDRIHTTFLDERLNPNALSYGALLNEARAFANGLWQRGVGPGDSVALMLPSDRSFFIAFMGTLLAGGIPVPIYPPVRPSQLESHLDRHARILANAEAKLLITVSQGKLISKIISGRVPSLRGAITSEELLAERQDGALDAAFAPNPDDPALIQYTSGSTGDPKGVVLTHSQLLANIRAMGEAVGVDDQDTFVSWLPLYHDMGLIGAWLGSSLSFGAHLVLMSPLTFLRRPVSWLQAIHRFQGTLSAAPNFAYEMAVHRIADADLETLDLTSWRMAFNGAEPISAQVIDAFCAKFAPFGFRKQSMAPVFGLAECSLGLTFPPPGQGPLVDYISKDEFTHQRRAVPVDLKTDNVLSIVGCGNALPGYRVRIVADEGQILPDRNEGRIQFQGPSSTSGYHRNRTATAALFDGDWLDTGDLGYLAEKGLFVTRRAKDMIIRGGRNLFPYDLEEAVGSIDGIRKGCVAVFGATDEKGSSERLVVLAEIRGELSSKIIQKRLTTAIQASSVEILGIPADDVVLAPPNSVLKTSSGKIRRSACRDAYETQSLGKESRPVWWQVARLIASGLPNRLSHLIAKGRRWTWGTGSVLIIALVALTFYPLILLCPRGTAWPIARAAIRVATTLTGTRPNVRGEMPIDQSTTCIIVANHASYMDWLVAIAALPTTFAFVAKSELLQTPLIGSLLTKLNTHFVERFDARQSVKDAAQVGDAVRAGQSLLVYPEGTFRRAAGLAPFRLGAFQAAVQSRAPIVPVTISGTRAMLPDGAWLPRPARIEVTISPALEPTGDDWAAAVALRNAARASIARHLDEPLLTFAVNPSDYGRD